MPAEPLSSPVSLGGLASAATTGALIAIGHRAGSIDVPFSAIGALVLSRRAAVGEIPLVLTGLVLNVVAVFVWSFLALWFARQQRWRLVPTAIVVAVLQFVLSWIVAWSTGHGLSSALALGDRIVYSVVLAVSLAVGMRFAFLSREMQDGTSSQRAHPL